LAFEKQPCVFCEQPTSWQGGTGHHVCAQCRSRHTEPIDDNVLDLPVPDPETWDKPAASGSLVNWAQFWTEDHDAGEWIVDPVIPAERGTALFAPAGEGKSELLLWLAVAAATGQEALENPPTDGVPVVYLDHEQTAGDLYDRLTDMGHGPGSDLSNLNYYLLPELPPLNTAEGADAVAEIVDTHEAKLVVIDTFSRVIDGNENDAEPYNDYYRLTGSRLKQAGVAVVRLDHAGKDKDKGQRGSSAKNDDVDLIWQIKRHESGTMLIARKRRMSWVPETISLTRTTGPVQYHGGTTPWPEGTLHLSRLLTQHNIPLDWGRQRIRQWFTQNHPNITLGKSQLVDKAQKYRRKYPNGEPALVDWTTTDPGDIAP